MTDLYPTPTRIDLLKDVRDGRIVWTGIRWWDRIRNRTHTAAIEEMLRAEWVTSTVISGPPGPTVERADLTDAGRAVLDGAA